MKLFLFLLLPLFAIADVYHYSTGGSGVDTVGTFSGSSFTDGAFIDSTTITFGPADSSNPGMLSTGSQSISGAKTWTSAPTFSAGGNFTLSGGTNTKFTRAKVAVNLLDSDTYLSIPGIDFYGGNTPSLLGEWDSSQFIIQTHMNFYTDNTFDLGGTYRPRNISAGSAITAGTYVTAGYGPIFLGLSYTTSTSNQALGANTHGIIIDPGSTTTAQTVTLPTSSNSANGEVIKVICGTNGITTLTVSAGSGTTVVGGGAMSCIATAYSWIYRSANTTWYPY